MCIQLGALHDFFVLISQLLLVVLDLLAIIVDLSLRGSLDFVEQGLPALPLLLQLTVFQPQTHHLSLFLLQLPAEHLQLLLLLPHYDAEVNSARPRRMLSRSRQ